MMLDLAIDAELIPLTSLTSLTSQEAWKLRNPKRAWAAISKRDAKKRAKLKGVPFELTIDYIVSIMTDECPVFKTAFNYGQNRGIQATSPSLDRIVPSLGYVPGNVVIISSRANNIKSAYGSKDLYKVADWLYEIEKNGV